MVEQVLYVLTKISSSLLHDIVSIQSYLKVGAGGRAGALCLDYGALRQHMDNGHMIRAFFKNIPNVWPIWADGSNKLWGISS